ncbi:hypothetical protein C8F01DRAFT_1127960 [Mycena amicta]|nr:hypothetical protein C8F01DRAFT_1127960 [Mycena amicta]
MRTPRSLAFYKRRHRFLGALLASFCPLRCSLPSCKCGVHLHVHASRACPTFYVHRRLTIYHSILPDMPAKKHIPWDTSRGDASPDDLHILPPYEALTRMPLPNQKRLKLEMRPLPTLPPPGSGVARPSAPRRRASGGNIGTPVSAAARSKTPVFFVCNRNENDSPISPAFSFQGKLFQPLSPPSKQEFPDLSRLSMVMHTIPPTPQTAGFVIQSPTSMLPGEGITPISPAFNLRVRPKRNCRHGFGGSIGSIPANVLEELRTLGEGRTPDTPTSGQDHSGEESSSSSESEYGEDEYYGGQDAGYGSDSLLLEAKNRNSWVHELDEDDRWVAEAYSDILRAL